MSAFLAAECSYTLNILNAVAWESARSWARPMVSPRIVVLRVTESPDSAVRFSHCQVNCISISKISIYILVAKWSGCCRNQLCVYPKQCVSLLVPFQSPQTCWYWLNKHGRKSRLAISHGTHTSPNLAAAVKSAARFHLRSLPGYKPHRVIFSIDLCIPLSAVCVLIWFLQVGVRVLSLVIL